MLRAVLSYSRKGYSEAVMRQDTESLLRCLENVLRHFGGVPLLLIIDNLKAAVLKADWFDPQNCDEGHRKRFESMRGKDGCPAKVPKYCFPLLDIKGCIRMSPRISHSSEDQAAKMNLPGDKTFRMLAGLGDSI